MKFLDERLDRETTTRLVMAASMEMAQSCADFVESCFVFFDDDLCQIFEEGGDILRLDVQFLLEGRRAVLEYRHVARGTFIGTL